jgi:hypothetical protein
MRLRDLLLMALLGGLVAVGLTYQCRCSRPHHRPAVKVNVDTCPDGRCPKACPCGPGCKCPGNPCPCRPLAPPCPPRRPWGDLTASVEASVGGYVTPDGERAACPLPDDYQRENVGGSDGAGLCVFTSIQHAAEWQDVPALKDFQQWMRSKPGGGYPSKVDATIRQKCREMGQPVPRYLQVEGNDLDILRLATRTGRMLSVTYSRSPTGRYGGGRIAHMVNCVHAGPRWFGILDNNYIKSVEWLDEGKGEFSKTYTGMGGGWSVILLDNGPPPDGPTPPGSAPLPRRYQWEEEGWVVGAPAAAEGLRWVPTPKPTQTALYRGDVQLGNWRHDEGGYFRLVEGKGGHSWEKAECPCDPPPGAVVRNEGIVLKEMHRGGQPCYHLTDAHGTREVPRSRAVELVGDSLPDDSQHTWIVFVGERTQRDSALLALKGRGDFQPALGSTRLKSYDPDHWHVKLRGLKPGVTVLRADGQELAYCTELHDGEKVAGVVLVALGLRQPATPATPNTSPVASVGAPVGAVGGTAGIILSLAGLGLTWWRKRRQAA